MTFRMVMEDDSWGRRAPVISSEIGGGWCWMLVARGGDCLVERGGAMQWQDGNYESRLGYRCWVWEVSVEIGH